MNESAASETDCSRTAPRSITVGPSPFKIVITAVVATIGITAVVTVLVVFLGFLASPWFLFHAGMIIAITAALVACYWMLALPMAIIYRRPRVVIGPEGFDTQGIIGNRWRRWSDIEGDFAVVRFALLPAIAYRLTRAFKESARIQPIASLAKQGHDEGILFCGELTMRAGDLAEVLNQWKQRGHGLNSAQQEKP